MVRCDTLWFLVGPIPTGAYMLATGVFRPSNWQLATGAIMYQLAILCTLCDQLATRNWQLATGGIEFHFRSSSRFTVICYTSCTYLYL